MQVLGIEHVQCAGDSSNELAENLPEMITYQVRGSIRTYSCLPRTTRSDIALTSLIARGCCWEELEVHVYADLYNVTTADEIKGVFLRSAIYCPFPSASTSFKIDMGFLAEYSVIEENVPTFIGSGCQSCVRWRCAVWMLLLIHGIFKVLLVTAPR